MTVQDLWSKLLQGVKQKKTKCFANIPAKECGRIGIDVSCWLHALCSTDEVAVTMLCDPEYPPDSALRSIKAHHREICQNKKVPVYVFGGCPHPMKKLTQEGRKKRRDDAKAFLQGYYEKGQRNEEITAEDRSMALKKMKICCRPTELLISMIIEQKFQAIIYFNMHLKLIQGLVFLFRSTRCQQIWELLCRGESTSALEFLILGACSAGNFLSASRFIDCSFTREDGTVLGGTIQAPKYSARENPAVECLIASLRALGFQ